MSSEARRMLEEMDQRSEARRMLEEAESGQAPKEVQRGLVDILADAVARPFNRGLANIPMMLPGGDSLKADLTNMGMISPDDQQAEGFLPRSMEILGGGVLPGGALMRVGQTALKAAPVLPELAGYVSAPAPQGVVAEAGKAVAQAPWKSLVADIMGSLGAGAGGEVAESYGAPESVQALAELGGGGLAAAAPAVAKPLGRAAGSAAGWVADQAEKLPLTGSLVRIGRDTIEGAKTINPYYRAAKQVQSEVVDPQAAAARITDPEMPPARQVDEERMLQLEKTVRDRGPAADSEAVDRHVANVVAAKKAEAMDFGGDTELPRQVLEQRGAQTVQRVRAKADKAAEEAEAALKDLDTGETWNISEAARKKITDAESAARDVEKELWGKVGWDSPGNYNNTQATVENITGKVGRALQDEVIPPAVRAELEAATEAGASLRDIHALRIKVQGLKGKAQLDPEQRANVKWLGELESALLKDMESVNAGDAAALKAAREQTKSLYDRFRRGKLGEVLGYSERATKAVADYDTLKNVMTGSQQSRDLEQMLNAAPETREDAVDYLRKSFLVGVTATGEFSQSAANRAISTMRKNRIFEVLPELEQQLVNATSKTNRAKLMQERAKIVAERGGARVERDAKQSLSSMYLGRDAGKEAGLLLDPKTKNPIMVARKLRSAMRGDEAAEEGLRQSFANALWESSKGPLDEKSALPTYKPAVFRKMVADHIETMKALGFPEDHIQLIKQFGATLRQATAKPGGQGRTELFTDIPGKIFNRVARVLGARAANWLHSLTGGTGAGPGLQTAQIGASSAQDIAAGLRVDPAERIIRDALDDPELMRALLLRDNATAAAKKKAVEKLNLWAAGVGIKGIADMDEDESP